MIIQLQEAFTKNINFKQVKQNIFNRKIYFSK
jgi:hypothetical protein